MRAATSPKRVLMAVSLAGLLALAVAAPASAQDAPGNNGTIKVHSGAGEPEDENKSEPQVCTFHIHAFNFDPNQQLDYTITNTATDQVAESGSFTVNDDGEGRDPASGAMSVQNAGSYRLDVTTSEGGSKSKVFQVTCEGGVLGGTLANTGGEASSFVTIAGLLMTMGAALILRSRRRIWGNAGL